jgi:hypothetical protein
MTTQGMWQILSDLLVGEKLPDSLNKDIYDLCEGKAVVVRELTDEEIDAIGMQSLKETISLMWNSEAARHFAHLILKKATEK